MLKRFAESIDDAGNLLGRLMDELHAEVPEPYPKPLGEMAAGFLRLGAEDRVPAAYVGHHRMRLAAFIAQRHAMFFARMAAIDVAGAFREEPAEHTMLGVENGQMMIDDRFKRERGDSLGQCGNLFGVEIVGWRQTRQAQVEQQPRSNRIGGVEAEVAV